MVNGYTWPIKEGEITFREFALRCARAFGYLVEMRDQSLDTEIPDEFSPNPFHREALERGYSDLEKAMGLSIAEAEREASKAYDKHIADHRRYVEGNAQLQSKYEKMLEQVRDWEQPTPEHQGLKDFMIKQLEEVIDFDCPTDHLVEPQKQSGAEYRKHLIERAKEDIHYHSNEYAQEVQLVKERTVWVSSLKKSLPNK